MTTAEQFSQMVAVLRSRRRKASPVPLIPKPRATYSQLRAEGVNSKKAVEITRASNERTAMKLPAVPPWADEAKGLRRKGWSIPGLAKRYACDQLTVAVALGEPHERDW